MFILAEADGGSGSILPQIILIIVLTLLNAFFASSELAVLSVNKTKINMLAEKGNKKAKRVLGLNQDQTKFLSTIQVGITLAGFFSSATAATALSDDFANLLVKIGLPNMPEVSMVIITLVLSYITLVFGELFPKRIALRAPEKVAMFVATPITFMKILMNPFVKLLSGSCNILVKITGLEKNMTEEKISEEEIMSLIKTGRKDGVVSLDEEKYIESVFDFDDLIAKEIMTPRVDCFTLDIDDPLAEQLKEMKKEKYTRFPVYEEQIDHIVGIINVKDILFMAQKVGFENLVIRDLLRKPIFIPEHYSVKKLMSKFLATNSQMAIVSDEFGGFAGLITLEDIMEELVGSINDEYDDEFEFEKIDDSTYLLSGNTKISDINRTLDLNIPKKDDKYITIGGLIIDHLGYIPKEKEEVMVKYQNVEFTIEKMKKNRIIEVKMKIVK